MPNTWKSIAIRKQRERASRIPEAWLLPFSYSTEAGYDNVLNVPRECGLLRQHELHITEDYDASGLIADLVAGKLKSVDVVTAFCKRAAIAQQLTNCLTEILFTDALARARQLDEHLHKTGKPMGPLHGLPISLKDTFKIKGYDASVGIAGFCFKPATANAALVDLLLELGAVLYCKTNVPQTMMALDSHNNVFGRTRNPANRHLTPGGSSGGEGALLAMRGSPLGVGTDVGGSIRVPSMCNGLVGVKPSHGRVPYAGQEGGAAPGSSKIAIESTAGPIARSVGDCEMFLRAIGNGVPWTFDPDVLPQTWDLQAPLHTYRPSTSRPPPLRVGILRTDGHVTPLPPIQRLLDDVSRALSQPPLPNWETIETFEVDISRLGQQCLKTFNGIVSMDGANTWLDHLDTTGEPLSPWLQSRLRRRPAKPVDEVKKLQGQITELQTKFLSMWKESGGFWNVTNENTEGDERMLDIIICPVAPHPIAPIDRWNTTNYTSIFNVLDYPAGVLPVRSVQDSDLDTELTKPELNGWDKVNRELWTNVDRKVYLGSMMSVQVIAPRLMERKLVEAMAILEKALAPLKENTSTARTSKL